MREWTVAGGVLESSEGLLLVQNRRRNGSLDWSTPGGVIDEGETTLDGLTREVLEETGLTVAAWADLAYRVLVDFRSRDMTLSVEAHVAAGWDGELVVDDPDGIVVAAAFADPRTVRRYLQDGPRWVSEPLSTWLDTRAMGETFRYVVTGETAQTTKVERV